MRTKILALMDNKVFLSLRDHWSAFLSSENSDMRKWCVHQLYDVTSPKQRKALIYKYVAQASYFYDVVFWLDRLTYATCPWQDRFASSLRDQIENPHSDL